MRKRIKAREIAGGAEPSEELRNTAVSQLVQEAVTPFMKAKIRRRLLEIRLQNEQTIDRHTKMSHQFWVRC